MHIQACGCVSTWRRAQKGTDDSGCGAAGRTVVLGRRAGREWVTFAGEERKNDALGRSLCSQCVWDRSSATRSSTCETKKKGAFHQDAVDGGRRGVVRTRRATVRIAALWLRSFGREWG